MNDKIIVAHATAMLLAVIENWGGGESYLKTSDGKEIACDVGYLFEGLRDLKEWAEKVEDDEID